MNKSVGVNEILDKLAKALGVEKDTELADAIGVSRQVLSTWRKRGTVPYEKLCEISSAKNISLDWLLLDKGLPTLMLDENPAVDAELNAIGEVLDQIPGRVAQDLVESDPRLLLIRRTLERISTSPVSTDRQRGIANVILKFVFGDKVAGDRFEGQATDLRELVEAARRDCQEAIEAVGYEPTHIIRLALETVMFGGGLTKERAAVLLKAMRTQSNLDRSDRAGTQDDNKALSL